MRIQTLARAAADHAVRLTIEARQAQADELAAINSAIRDRAALPEHFWQRRHDAEMRAKAARDFASALALEI